MTDPTITAGSSKTPLYRSELLPPARPITRRRVALALAAWIGVTVLFLLSLRYDVLFMSWRYAWLPKGPEGMFKQVVHGFREFGQVMPIVVTLLIIARMDRRRGTIIATVLMAQALAAVSYNPVKLVVGRYRPDEAIQKISPLDRLQGEQTWIGWRSASTIHATQSFPSGHSAAGIALAAVLGWFYPRLRVVVWPLGLGCCVSRYVDGVHWLSDCLAGGAIGYLCAYLALRPRLWLGRVIPQLKVGTMIQTTCGLLILGGLMASCSAAAGASAEPELVKLLAQPIGDPARTLEETRRFCEARIARLPTLSTAEAWTQYADGLRERVLDKVVFRGQAAAWRDAPCRVEWLDTMPGGPGYQIRKLRFEALPGMWVSGLLYEPLRLEGRVPVCLNVNGHEPLGKAAPYKQIRCINMAKRGMLALNVDWFHMGQLKTAGSDHQFMPQLDLCGTSGVAVHYLLMKRALDLLLAHPHADPSRVAMAGLSGGGWQTIFFSSLDTRVVLANPVAGYSSFLTRARVPADLGDAEQTPSDLAELADYLHLTAMRAPRPTLLTFNQTDNCCFAAPTALPPLLAAAEPVFRLLGAPHSLASHINAVPGTHNFEQDNREAFYAMLGKHFFADRADFDAKEIASEAEVRKPEELLVPLPSPNHDFNSLARMLMADLPRKPVATAPVTAETPSSRLARIARFRDVPQAQITAEPVETAKAARFEAFRLKLADQWTVPVRVFSPESPAKGKVIVIADGPGGLPAAIAAQLAAGKTVIVADPWYFGQSSLPDHQYLYAYLVACVGERPIGIQATQIVAVARWAGTRGDPGVPDLVCHGPRLGLAARIAVGCRPTLFGSVSVNGELPSLKQPIEANWSAEQFPELFCFGLLEAFDIPQLKAMAAAR